MRTLSKWLETRKFISAMDEKYGKAYLGVETQLDQKIVKMSQQSISRRQTCSPRALNSTNSADSNRCKFVQFLDRPGTQDNGQSRGGQSRNSPNARDQNHYGQTHLTQDKSGNDLFREELDNPMEKRQVQSQSTLKRHLGFVNQYAAQNINMDSKQASGRKLRNYYPKFSSQESADTFKDFSSIFNGDKFKMQAIEDAKPNAPPDQIYDALQGRIQACDLKVSISKCKSGQN